MKKNKLLYRKVPNLRLPVGVRLNRHFRYRDLTDENKVMEFIINLY